MLIYHSQLHNSHMLNSLKYNSLIRNLLTSNSHTLNNHTLNNPMRNSHMPNSSLRKSQSLKNRKYSPLTCLFVPVAIQQLKKTGRERSRAMLAMEESLLEGSLTGETTSLIVMAEQTHTQTVSSPRMLRTG